MVVGRPRWRRANEPVQAPGYALPLQLPPGAAIFAVRGIVWITQERLRDDIILAPGERFEVGGRGLVLASAVRGDAALHIVGPAIARAFRQRSLHEFVRAQAESLRREEFGRVAGHIGSWSDRLLARLRALASTRPRAMGH